MLPSPPLLLITDRTQARGDLGGILAAAFGAGLRWVSVREKDLPEAEQVALVRALLPVAHAYGARLKLHGSAALAAAAGADGVHLPAGADAAAARALLGPAALVGLSIHSEAEAAAAPAGVSYLIAGPAFLTASKPGYGPALGPEGLARLARATARPLLALGGIDAATLAACRACGIAGAAVMGGIMRAADPAAEARALIAAWG
ncbi:thiamine phosphate synthase [Azorhizobium doebereinerae]|uniref:thiamine phosphate synthase n=1 Tax=Azorhizobium doebereinerae TaxID=281091 RepID=UPI000424DE0F|nr:thiamine phosphate synthase [Azorhizobium doebereinerae]